MRHINYVLNYLSYLEGFCQSEGIFTQHFVFLEFHDFTFTTTIDIRKQIRKVALLESHLRNSLFNNPCCSSVCTDIQILSIKIYFHVFEHVKEHNCDKGLYFIRFICYFRDRITTGGFFLQ